MREREVVAQFRDWCKYNGWYVIRNQQNIGSHKGLSDFTIIKRGVVIFVELKGDGGRLSEAQKKFQENIESAGGNYIVAYTIEEAAKQISRIYTTKQNYTRRLHMRIVDDSRVTSGYGIIRTLPDGSTNKHNGLDVVSLCGNTTVYAVSDGYVEYDFDAYAHAKRYSKPNTGGNMIIVLSLINNEIYHVRYLHLVKNFVKHGQDIKAGDPIGEYGDVGYSFGAHVHIDIWNYEWSKTYNPIEIVPDIAG